MPNSTKQERDIVDSTDYKVDPSCIRGFKFKYGEEILPWLIEAVVLKVNRKNENTENNF